MEETKKKKGLISIYTGIPLVYRVLTALVLGVIAGLVFGPKIEVVEPLGALMLRLLQMVVLPLIFFSIVTGVGGTPASKLGRIAGKIMAFYIGTKIFSTSFAIIIAKVMKPGAGITLSGANGAASVVGEGIAAPPISQIFLEIIPNNVVAAFVEGSFLQVLMFAVFFGLAISFLKDSKDERVRQTVNTVYDFCEGASEIIFKITQSVLEYTPIGVFALIALVFAQDGLAVLGPLGKLVIACYIGYIFQLTVVYSTFLKLGGLSPKVFFSKAKDITLMGFATRSSNSVLPLSLKVSEEDLGISNVVGGFTLPLGAQINMDGEAYYQILSVFFIANAIGLNLTFSDQILMILVVTLGSIGTAGVSGAGPVVLLAVLEMVGIDMSAGTPAAAAFALILGIDVILDMGRTAINVTGDLVGTAIVANSENMIDKSKWELSPSLEQEEVEKVIGRAN